MARLLLISNRLPITVERDSAGLSFFPSAGGLATGLRSIDRSLPQWWIGWPGLEATDPAEQLAIEEALAPQMLCPVFLTQEEIRLYYEGFSNKTIWPHFHYFTQYTTYRDDFWEAYLEVNHKFAKAVIALAQPDDLIWVHDYQLMLLPNLIRQQLPQATIGFFLHIPFPSYELFRVLPWRKALLQGMLGANQIGFHTFGYMRHFLSAAYRITGHEHQFGKIKIDGRLINVDVFPMGIDYQQYAAPATDLTATDSALKISNVAQGRQLVISIDRLDYTKGIPQRLKAFQHFIASYPEYQGKVSLILLVVPSRANVDNYQELKQQVDTLVGEINGTYGNFDWTPIQYLYRSLNFNELLTLYHVANVAMITPLRDGMNLVAKEFIASKHNSRGGVLILSEMAGAAIELSEALIVNPHDIKDTARALYDALTMDPVEQRRRLEIMQQHLQQHSVSHWAQHFITELQRVMEHQEMQNQFLELEGEARITFFNGYKGPKKRLLMLDYDGTLMPFHPDPQAVAPDIELLQTLSQLSTIPGNKLVINSGRDWQTLERWLGPLGIDMAAEHGVWIKRNGQWNINPGLSAAWKEDIRSILQNLVDRTPGSFIEEKDYSLAWHYRRIDRDLGAKRVREIRDGLLYFTANLDLQVLEGNKVVEIKHASVSKGKAALGWLNEADWQFICAIGDDRTDEDIFKTLPPAAFAVKVGGDRSFARYYLPEVADVRVLLRDLVKASFE